MLQYRWLIPIFVGEIWGVTEYVDSVWRILFRDFDKVTDALLHKT